MTESRPEMRRAACGVAGALPLIAVIALCGCKAGEKPAETIAAKVDGDKITFPTNAPQLPYLVVEPARERKAAAIGLSGRLAWDDDVTVRVFSPASGRVVGIHAEVNLPVRKGDVLASLESADYGQATSDVQKAAADLALADRNVTRLRELFQHGAAAQKDVDSAEADYVKAKSEHARATAQLLTLSYGRTNNTVGVYELCSPLDGIVVEKNINPGQQVRSDQMLANAPQFVNPLFTVSDPTHLWLWLDVVESDLSFLATNQEVVVRSRALPGKEFHGRLEVVGGGLEPTTRTVKARCLVDNPERLLRAEMYVSADIISDARTALEIPTSSIFLKNNHSYVFVETAPGKFERRTVRIGSESNERSTISEGLSAGERVVTDGCLLLQAILDGDNS